MTIRRRFPEVLAALAIVCVTAGLLFASNDPPGTYTYFNATSTPAAGLLLRTGSAVVGSINVYNATGGAAFLQLFDRTTQPSSGTGVSPVWEGPSCGNNIVCVITNIPAGGIRFTTGVYIGFSSTGASYTAVAGASTGSVELAYR